jgi:hypothetical protein
MNEKDSANEVLSSAPEETTPKELTDEEKHDLFIKQLKDSKNNFKTGKAYGAEYKKNRKRKNKAQKASRKKNR